MILTPYIETNNLHRKPKQPAVRKCKSVQTTTKKNKNIKLGMTNYVS